MICTTFIPAPIKPSGNVIFDALLVWWKYELEITRCETWIKSMNPSWVTRCLNPGMYEISFEIPE